MTQWSRDHIKRFIIKDHHASSLLTIWSLDQMITWLVKNVKFLLPRELWLKDLTEWWVLMQTYYPQSHITCWSRGHTTNEKRYKFIFTWPVAIKLDRRVVTWCLVTNELHYIFILQRLLPLNLTGWWPVKLKSRLRFN